MMTYVITYSIVLLSYSLFFYIVRIAQKNNNGDLKTVLSGHGSPGILLSLLAAGIILLGIGTAVVILTRSYNEKIFIPVVNGSVLPAWIIIVAALLTGLFGTEKKLLPSSLNIQPLSFSFPFLFILLRTLFLIIYEIFFRGIMLFCLIGDFGIAVAVFINLLLYVLIHWQSDKKERYGSVLMGLVLCFITIYYQNVWPAIAIHLMLALSNEIGILITNRSLIKKPSI
jgi:membrane protease YdiL (CAAX protease family)